jgi:hypothetical protein
MGMKIEIFSDGATVQCKVNNKDLYLHDSLMKAVVSSILKTIINGIKNKKI